jgi:hypothetical protein
LCGYRIKRRRKIPTLELIDSDGEYDSLSTSSDTGETYDQIMMEIDSTNTESEVSALPATAEVLAGFSTAKGNADAEILRHASELESDVTERASALTSQGERHISLDRSEVDSTNAQPEASESELPNLEEGLVDMGGSQDNVDGRNGNDNIRRFDVFHFDSGRKEVQHDLTLIEPGQGKRKERTWGKGEYPCKIQKIQRAELRKPRFNKSRRRRDTALARRRPLQVSEARPEVGCSHEPHAEQSPFLENDAVMGGTDSATDKETVCTHTIGSETSEPVDPHVQGRDDTSMLALYETKEAHNPRRVDTLSDGHSEVADLKRLEVGRTDAESVEKTDVRDSVRAIDYRNDSDYAKDVRRASDTEERQRTPALIEQGDEQNREVLIPWDESYDYTGTAIETGEPVHEPDSAFTVPGKENDYNTHEEQML